MDEGKIIEVLATHQAKIEDMDKRLVHCEKTTDSINNLAQSIAKMGVTLENTNETVKELKEDVHSLKEKPIKQWDGLMTTATAAIASGIIGYMLSGLL